MENPKKTENYTNQGAVYNNAEFIHHAGRVLIMEAEQLNIIENRLADLGQRATELRRYL
jgi:hypothetical protein